jgi:hypothetical protein
MGSTPTQSSTWLGPFAFIGRDDPTDDQELAVAAVVGV